MNIKSLVFVMAYLPYFLYAQWSPVQSLPGAGSDGCFSASIGGMGYVGGGTGRKSLYEYNPATNTWTKKADIPGPSQRAWSGSFVAGNHIYIIGGDSTFKGLLRDVWMYDPANDKWTRKADFPGGERDGMFCWSITINLKTKVYVGGGFDGQLILNDFYSYDPVTDTWQTLPGNIPEAMLFASAFVLNDKGYVTQWEGAGFNNALWEYDPASNEWTAKNACPGMARGEGIGFSINGYGYAGLGQINFSRTYTDLYRYDPAKDAWMKLADTFPATHTGWSTAFVIGNTVYAGTGATLPNFSFSNKFYKQSMIGTSVLNLSSENDLQIYNNPLSGMLSYSSSKDIKEVKVFDIQGRCVGSELTGQSKTIDVSGFAPGMYTLLFYTPSEVLTRKAIISK